MYEREADDWSLQRAQVEMHPMRRCSSSSNRRNAESARTSVSRLYL